MKYKAILFDMDGVLIDSYYSWFHLFNDTLKHFNLPEISDEEFRKKAWGGPIEKDIKDYFKEQSIEEISEYYFSNFENFTEHLKIFPDVGEVLKELKGKEIKIGLVTNTFSEVTKSVLNHFKIIDFFDVIVSGDDVKKGKPEPDMMLKACEVLGIKAGDVILIGDTENDMLAGKRAGCFTVGIGVKGDAKIDDLKEVFNLL